MNKILAFDVSTNICSVALSEGRGIIACREELTPSIQAEILLELIEQVLVAAGYRYQDLDYIVTTNGPGSFTGIRIGLSAISGIALAARNVKVAAVSNFEASHYRATWQRKNYQKIIIILNAYRQQLYVQEFDKNGNLTKKPELINYPDVRKLLISAGEEVVCAGNGLAVIYNLVQDLDNITILPRFPRIKAMHLCQLVNDKINQDMAFLAPEPLYIRPPDAKKPDK
ncbi:MAG: tRNA (adenosine(37)-N6)-threonylcarbamoyltransferase complex dimerization subunit type 1 TsaB [Rickettsiaceae bacterium]|nr:tRNA (adenosine(37)-N6)-threonylcarbamoyltransferase complex dimerization subunit type 1 TsaB [Rickettsiaceae bacterium]